MRPLIVNALDRTGGAGRAASRLHRGLRQIGVSSRMLVQTKRGDESSVWSPLSRKERFRRAIFPFLDSQLVRFYPERELRNFSPNLLGEKLAGRINEMNPDIVHLNWICNGFIPVGIVNHIRSPIIWTLHDLWAVTGGCHQPDDCIKYETVCGACPKLGSRKTTDLSRFVFDRKRRCWKPISLTLVSPSNWLAQKIKRSALFGNRRIEIIPNGIDTDLYRPIEKKAARSILGLPAEAKIILFGAVAAFTESRKGFAFLLETIGKLAKKKRDHSCQLIVFGASLPEDLGDIGMKARFVGPLEDDVTLALYYSSADVFVMPSKNENLPYTVMESLACGTPAAAFDVGGVSDLVEHGQNGYLAKPYDTDDLANGIEFIIEDPLRAGRLSDAARRSVLQKCEITKIARQYCDLYASVRAQAAENPKERAKGPDHA